MRVAEMAQFSQKNAWKVGKVGLGGSRHSPCQVNQASRGHMVLPQWEFNISACRNVSMPEGRMGGLRTSMQRQQVGQLLTGTQLTHCGQI